jgi:hypothetical protein
MDEREAKLRELMEGLDGLVMLSQWELSLATELRRKMAGLLPGKAEPGAEEDPSGGPLGGEILP